MPPANTIPASPTISSPRPGSINTSPKSPKRKSDYPAKDSHPEERSDEGSLLSSDKDRHPERAQRVEGSLCHPAYTAGREILRLARSEEHTSELQSLAYLVCRLLLEK